MLKPHDVRAIYMDHCEYWRQQRPQLRLLRNLYMMRYWKKGDNLNDKVSITVESSRGYELVESIQASLFTKDPAVTVGPDVRGRGNPTACQWAVNDGLHRARKITEHASRLSSVYGASYLKTYPVPGPDPFQRIEFEAVCPWDIIIDAAASSWETQRWVGHRYLVPLEEAIARYGNKKYAPRAFHRFLDDMDDNQVDLNQSYARGGPDDSMSRGMGRSASSVPSSTVEKFIEVVEFYDLTPGQDRLVVWSPDYANGDKFLFAGVKVQEGSSLDTPPPTDAGMTDEEIEQNSVVYSGIPYRTVSGRIAVPIVEWVYTEDINAPLRGYSALRRAADYIQEMNIIRSYQANAVRKTARQWLIEKGLLDADAAAKIAMGVDGEIIEVELSNGQTLSGSVMPVPHVPTPPELQSYIMEVEGDLNRGSIMAPFTRGEATKATATEVTALASYTSSEIGRMARVRDEAIAQLARVYSIMLSLILGDGSEPIVVNGKTMILTSSDLTADFKFYATDSGATPLADAAKRQNLVNLTPTLVQLGVDPQAIRAEIVRLYDLPESFLGGKEEAPTAATPGQAGEAVSEPSAPDAPQNLATALAQGPSPANITPMLGG